MYKIVSSVLLVFSLVTSLYAEPLERIPNANLRVTVQQKENNKIGNGYHVLELSCWDNDCALSSVSLNQCENSVNAFYPKVQFSTTWGGDLEVKATGNSLIVKESGADIGGDYITTLRFDYIPSEKGKILTKLIGFSGGFVKNSVILKGVITVDYIPLSKGDQIIKLDCNVLLPGIDQK